VTPTRHPRVVFIEDLLKRVAKLSSWRAAPDPRLKDCGDNVWFHYPRDRDPRYPRDLFIEDLLKCVAKLSSRRAVREPRLKDCGDNGMAALSFQIIETKKAQSLDWAFL